MGKYNIYMHKFPNGKMYIGKTKKIPTKRWQNGTGYDFKKQSAMYNAIQEFGWDNIEHIVLYERLSEVDATARERALIKKYNTYYYAENSNGYNMTLGGDGTRGHKAGEKVRETNRKKHLGKTGDLCPNSHAVICDGKRYESITAFCEQHNLSRGMVEAWLKGKYHMPKEWFDKGLRKENGENKVLDTPQEKDSIDIVEYDGMVFNGQAELARFLGVSPALVCNWFCGRNKIPKAIYDKGIKLLNRDTPPMIVQDKVIKTKTAVEYDGQVYESQAKLADFLGVKKGTLNSWLKGKNKMPKQYEEKGLKYYDK